MAMLMCSVVCLGLVAAVAAGVAYGYNYSMSEYLTYKREDVSVYMRKGSFHGDPHYSRERNRARSRDVINYLRETGEDESSSENRTEENNILLNEMLSTIDNDYAVIGLTASPPYQESTSNFNIIPIGKPESIINDYKEESIRNGFQETPQDTTDTIEANSTKQEDMEVLGLTGTKPLPTVTTAILDNNKWWYQWFTQSRVNEPTTINQDIKYDSDYLEHEVEDYDRTKLKRTKVRSSTDNDNIQIFVAPLATTDKKKMTHTPSHTYWPTRTNQVQKYISEHDVEDNDRNILKETQDVRGSTDNGNTKIFIDPLATTDKDKLTHTPSHTYWPTRTNQVHKYISEHEVEDNDRNILKETQDVRGSTDNDNTKIFIDPPATTDKDRLWHSSRVLYWTTTTNKVQKYDSDYVKHEVQDNDKNKWGGSTHNDTTQTLVDTRATIHHYHVSRKTSTAGHRPPSRISTTTTIDKTKLRYTQSHGYWDTMTNQVQKYDGDYVKHEVEDNNEIKLKETKDVQGSTDNDNTQTFVDPLATIDKNKLRYTQSHVYWATMTNHIQKYDGDYDKNEVEDNDKNKSEETKDVQGSTDNDDIQIFAPLTSPINKKKMLEKFRLKVEGYDETPTRTIPVDHVTAQMSLPETMNTKTEMFSHFEPQGNTLYDVPRPTRGMHFGTNKQAIGDDDDAVEEDDEYDVKPV